MLSAKHIATRASEHLRKYDINFTAGLEGAVALQDGAERLHGMLSLDAYDIMCVIS